MSAAGKPKKEVLSRAAWIRIEACLTEHIGRPERLADAEARFSLVVPTAQRQQLEDVLTKAPPSYRDVLIIQLASRLSSATHIDVTKRAEGARTVAPKLGTLLAKSHIAAVKDAFQNIGKNVVDLIRGNVPASDNFLQWAAASERTPAELEAVFDYICARTAATARPVKAMPDLDQGKLTFGKVVAVLDDLVSAGSQGAYEQMIIASFLEALVDDGSGRFRVTTKNLTASDKSSTAAGDIQVWAGSALVDAFEVTANPWTEKLPGAEKTMRDHDIRRLNIIGRVEDPKATIEALRPLDVDVAVRDVRGFYTNLVADLRKPGRAAALRRLHELLVRYQPDTAKVDKYVDLLVAHGLTTSV